MGNLATLVDLELVLQQSLVGDEQLAAAEFALLSASSAIRNYCNQYIERVDNEVIVLDCKGGRYVFLPELPVISVVEVREAGVLLTSPDDYQLMENGVLARTNWYWKADIQSIQVTYSHGHRPIPDDIVVVAARAASRMYQAGLRAVDTGGVLGVASKSLGDFSVSYTAEAAAEGLMGASGARMLLLSEKDLLDKYKL